MTINTDVISTSACQKRTAIFVFAESHKALARVCVELVCPRISKTANKFISKATSMSVTRVGKDPKKLDWARRDGA